METQNKNLKSYNIKFSMHLKQLLNSTNKIEEIQLVYNYIKKILDIKLTFFFDDQRYKLYKRKKAMELTPGSLRKTFRKIVDNNIIKTKQEGNNINTG